MTVNVLERNSNRLVIQRLVGIHSVIASLFKLSGLLLLALAAYGWVNNDFIALFVVGFLLIVPCSIMLQVSGLYQPTVTVDIDKTQNLFAVRCKSEKDFCCELDRIQSMRIGNHVKSHLIGVSPGSMRLDYLSVVSLDIATEVGFWESTCLSDYHNPSKGTYGYRSLYYASRKTSSVAKVVSLIQPFLVKRAELDTAMPYSEHLRQRPHQ